MRFLRLNNLPIADRIGLALGLAVAVLLLVLAVLGRVTWWGPLVMIVCLTLAWLIFMWQDARASLDEIEAEVKADADAAIAEAKAAWAKVVGGAPAPPPSA